MIVSFLKLDPRAVVPEYATEKSSAFDFVAIEDVTVWINETVLVDTGLAIVLPEDTELQIRPRSGLSLKTGLRIANTPGTIDQDYVKKPIGIICWNTGSTPLLIKAGDRIAQGVIAPVIRAQTEEVNEAEYDQLSLSNITSRKGGYGSTQ